MTESDPSGNVFALRMWRSLLATQEVLSAYLGVKLGLYETLAAGGALTAPELSRGNGVAVRYAREWLEQQAVAAILEVDDVRLPWDERRYSLPAAHAQVLTVSEHPASMAALAVLPLGGIAAALPQLLDGYRSGAGVPDSAFGDDWRNGHSGANRALFTHQLGDWIEKCLPDVHERLVSATAPAIADVACGSGWSSLALARAYPNASIRGLDIDAAAIEAAAGHARAAGLDDRVGFEARDVLSGEHDGGAFDLVCLFDVLHEVPWPVPMLRACRSLSKDDGVVLLMDAKVAPTFTAPGDDIERFQYATSVLHCLPAALSGPLSQGTGTALRPRAVRELATEAGFSSVTLLPAIDRFHRLYRLG